MKNKIASTSSC